MRKFCSNQQFLHALESSEEESLLHLLSPFLTSKDSLKCHKLPELPILSEPSLPFLITFAESCKLVPPIEEAYLNSDELEIVDSILKTMLGTQYQRTLLLHQYSSAAYINGELYGSINSIHSNSSLCFAKSSANGSIGPGMIYRFVIVTVFLNQSTSVINKSVQICLCGLDWLLEHPEKNWFHLPIEVWRKWSQNMQPSTLVPSLNVMCRCAYLIDTITFSHALEEFVMIIVPLNNFSGLLQQWTKYTEHTINAHT